jgi:glycosyltransferase involved in cell wall biosynthesis
MLQCAKQKFSGCTRCRSAGSERARAATTSFAAVDALHEAVRGRLRVTLAGDGEVDGVRAAVAVAGLGDTIKVAGWLDPAARDELLANAHIFLLPSWNEGLPVALLEAMAHGLAPVATMVGSVGEAITDGVNALVVQPGRPDQIAEALTKLVTDERLCARLGAAARSLRRRLRARPLVRAARATLD